MNSRDIALGDVDGDGDLDAVVANYQQQNQLLINDGSGNFVASFLPEPSLFATGTQAVAMGDADSDGDLDVIVVNYQGFNLLLSNDGTGTFSYSPLPPVNQTNTFNASDVAVGDLNGDGAISPVDAHGLPNINTAGLLPDIYVI